MTLEVLEQRLAVVEAELAHLKKRLEQETTPKTNPWLDQFSEYLKTTRFLTKLSVIDVSGATHGL